MNADTLTILRAHGKRLAKLIDVDGKVHDYEGAFKYTGYTLQICNLQELGALLRRLLPCPDCAIVRGELIGGAEVAGIRRLLHEKDGRDAPTLRHVQHHWLAIDCDSIPRPDDIAVTDIAGCAEAAIALLPSAFHDANCIAVASGSHGIKPGIRIRLWFWLSRPMGVLSLKRWLRSVPIDRSLFSPAQLTYTAAPVFAAGRDDHLSSRLVELPGEELVHPPSEEELAPALPAQSAHVGSAPNEDRDKYVTAALVGAATNILAAQVGNRHVTLVHEACCLARYVNLKLLTASEVIAVLTAAAQQAGKDDPDEIESAIDWGLSNANINPVPEELRHAS